MNGDTTKFVAELAASLREHTALPYLFIGSGLPRRYLGLPDWEGMLRHFADEMDEDLDYILASTNADLPLAASMLAKKFHPIWFKERRYAKQRTAFKSSVRDDIAAFKVAVAEYFKEASKLDATKPGVNDSALSREMEALKNVVVDGIITTNYDNLTDQIFPHFKSYVGQDELLLSDAQFVAEAYKIHGSCENPHSLILTSEDYEEFEKRNSYLAAKLLTIFAEHPVIFIGYNLGDGYIRKIIDNIARAVGPSRLTALQKQIYFVEWNSRPDTVPSMAPYFLEVADHHSLPAQKVEVHSFLPIYEALAQLERPFPANMLRELRKYVYNLVAHPDPDQARETIRVIPFDSEDASKLRVVFGIGPFSDKDLQDISGISGRTLTREDLAQDVLGVRSRGIDSRNALHYGIPTILQHSANAYMPVYKYLRDCELIGSNGKIDTTALPGQVSEIIARLPQPNAQNMRRYEKDFKNELTTPNQVFDADLPDYFKLDCLLCINQELFDINELRLVLAKFLNLADDLNGTARTNLFKAIAHYDRIRYS